MAAIAANAAEITARSRRRIDSSGVLAVVGLVDDTAARDVQRRELSV
jgi:hypothetical protein